MAVTQGIGPARSCAGRLRFGGGAGHAPGLRGACIAEPARAHPTPWGLQPSSAGKRGREIRRAKCEDVSRSLTPAGGAAPARQIAGSCSCATAPCMQHWQQGARGSRQGTRGCLSVFPPPQHQQQPLDPVTSPGPHRRRLRPASLLSCAAAAQQLSEPPPWTPALAPAHPSPRPQRHPTPLAAWWAWRAAAARLLPAAPPHAPHGVVCLRCCCSPADLAGLGDCEGAEEDEDDLGGLDAPEGYEAPAAAPVGAVTA